MSWIKTDNGLTIADMGEILREVQTVFTDAFPNLNLDPSTPQGQIITRIAEKINDAAADIAELGSMFFAGGTGKWLDARNNTLFGISRKGAVKGSVTAIISGVPGTIIPAGFQASGDGHIFETIAVYDIGVNGSVNAELFAQEDGSFQIQAGTLTQILTPVSGVERINNPFISVQGQAAETDAAFRQRGLESLYFNAKSIFGGMLARIRQLEGVSDVGGYENKGNTAVTIRGTVMPPHSINTIVKGGDINDIGETMLLVKNPGCDMGGNVSANVYEPESGQTYEMLFYRPVETALAAKLTVKIGENVTQDYASKAAEQLSAYVDTVRIGADISPWQMISAVNIPDMSVQAFQLGKKGEALSSDIISLSFLEDPVLNINDVEVVLNV